MKFATIALAALLPVGVFAQETIVGGVPAQGLEKRVAEQLQVLISQAKGVEPVSLALSAPVQGAPYSAEEVSTFHQALGDGTVIHRENRTQVYRDGQGRTRRETPELITISNPTTGLSYQLDPATKIARKITVSFVARATTNGDGSSKNFVTVVNTTVPGELTVHSGGGGGARVGAVTTTRSESVVLNTNGPTPHAVAIGAPVEQKLLIKLAGLPKSESLGTGTFSGGVAAEGTRVVSQIDAGQIGNDRPIVTTSETWFSKELGITLKTVSKDPRNGDQTTELVNIRRGEPSADLFELPAGYQVAGQK